MTRSILCSAGLTPNPAVKIANNKCKHEETETYYKIAGKNLGPNPTL